MLCTGPLHVTTNDSDSDVVLGIDERFEFVLNQREAQLLLDLKLQFNAVFSRYLHNRSSFKVTPAEMQVLNAIVKILIEEDMVEKRIKMKRSNSLSNI